GRRFAQGSFDEYQAPHRDWFLSRLSSSPESARPWTTDTHQCAYPEGATKRDSGAEEEGHGKNLEIRRWWFARLQGLAPRPTTNDQRRATNYGKTSSSGSGDRSSGSR